MHTLVVEPRRGPIVPLGTLKQHLRLDDEDTSQDLVLDAMLDTATALIDGPEGWLGRALGEQVLELRAERFPCAERGIDRGPVLLDGWALVGDASYAGYGCDLARAGSRAVLLDCPPIACVEAVIFRDTTRTMRVLDPAGYSLFGRVLLPAYGTDWPFTADGAGAVTIRYRAGYNIPGATPDLPPQVTSSLLLKTASLYENRESAAGIVNATDERLLQQLRVYA